MRDGRRQRGDRTRERVLVPAVALATVKGLEGFSYSDLAGVSGVSKASIATLFGDKHGLQEAITERARRILHQRVFEPVVTAPPGLPRLETLGQVWFDYLTDPELEGGCFFAAALFEVDAQPGPLQELVRDDLRRWISGIEAMVRDGQATGQIRESVDAGDVALELFSVGVVTNAMIQLGVVDRPADRARRIWADHLDRLRVPSEARGTYSEGTS
jgi:AcrR family transcriptional regulator